VHDHEASERRSWVYVALFLWHAICISLVFLFWSILTAAPADGLSWNLSDRWAYSVGIALAIHAVVIDPLLVFWKTYQGKDLATY